ncbi:bifunctional glutamate N-acetyltransferase/amino-acid acetyltransferase ArgJ [Nitratireductor aquimarinus]|uniref:Arginine biosynthesis bifunctional protein ArgJ n=1 Tax=Nitratireductor aquimarinus TaxID=889300 RepID=A0ABU4AQ63_9HYPH|nr:MULTISPECIES: bifunctional glutamate N-acetyltransferase/amino-acid acetyltransferase ArgJ [Nitratireductor]MBN7762177.1 bifunctional glutamate N-acetyltransferase/amino-acid acetyltransferase ArgJ [Nitratireductor aquibiodomus]MBN7778100.1 bifunctional glutamate N-acetyltransferase/amino-acid acetyltransferase ArgJ [Nitratireductor pacificus]MBN7782422.1 bifunctional glutamate N-acetyltransferase/amino-acid acetyltransferase ArgJ [Nitratireductor pacificus]MBN7791229.1 bifunctional glutamat
MSVAVSPLAPKTYPDMPAIDGVRIATAEAGVKYKGRTDLLTMVFDEGTTAAGVFTQSKCPSAPVELCRENLAGGEARILVVNSGNANAFTGKKGRATTSAVGEAAAAAVKADKSTVFMASTGVIGEPLPAERITGFLEGMAAKAAPGGWLEAARAIMTTDTYPKVATATVRLGEHDVVINGIAKGAGMIAPDMATMLSFVATDAPIAAPVLQDLLSRGTGKTFNAVTVDSDTSTSDTLMMFATGAAAKRGVTPINDLKDPRLAGFRRALNRILKNLALQIVRDGEGARKQLEITVTGAKSSRSAKKIAMSIANSPLVKTAVAGEDANWGRVVMAVGKAGEPAERDLLSIWFGDIRVAHEGERDPAYSEEETSAYMKKDEITLRVDLGLGRGKATVWTCDLTKEYVAINGDYRS